MPNKLRCSNSQTITIMKSSRKPTEEQKAAAAAKRAQLCAMTTPFRPYVERNVEAVTAVQFGGMSQDDARAWLTENGVPAQFQFCMTLNACLEVVYRGTTGQTEFRSFQGWKEAGYSVEKGQKGFMIWSTPKQMKLKAEMENVETGETESQEKTVHRFALAYLFHAGQVSNEAGERPASYRPETVTQSDEAPAAEVEAAPAPETTPAAEALTLTEERTIWNSDSTDSPVLICMPPPPQLPQAIQAEFDLLAA